MSTEAVYGPPRRGIEVDLTPFRLEAERQNREGRTWTDMANAMGYRRTARKRAGGRLYAQADTSRLQRTLGMRMQSNTHRGIRRHYPPSKRCHYWMAVKLAEMLGADPVDFGL